MPQDLRGLVQGTVVRGYLPKGDPEYHPLGKVVGFLVG
jgi:hypothetical protein